MSEKTTGEIVYTPMLGELLINRYRVDAELGRGGIGVVYRAFDELLKRPVAVKLLSSYTLEEHRPDRLLHEAQSAAQLNHPNIVAVYDAGEQAGTAFIVMEFVQGRTLHDRRPETIDETLAITRQIGAALEHAHAHGIVHRDLKPENVILVGDGPHPLAKLMDFGLASPVATRLTGEGTIAGTVFYLAPELALGQAFDGRADLYALGVMLYELLTGRLPFQADDPLAVISQHLYAPVVPPRAYQEAIPPALDALVIRLMSKRPDDRPATAGEVRQALEALAGAQIFASDSALVPLDWIERGRLVGRSSEQTALRELWMHAHQGHAHLVLISGEPGIGKTRLARELITYARLQGAAVLQGGCHEYEAAVPYLPLAEALSDWVQAQSDPALEAGLGSTATELSKLVSEIRTRLGPLPSNPPLSPEEERLRLFDHLARFLQGLAAPAGLLLFIDDLHWSDRGTLLLLHYLLRRLRNARLLVLATYREVELDRAHPLAEALVEWNRERLAARLQLGRLTLEECSALLAGMFGQLAVSPEFTQAIYQETEGNPFFIEEVIKSLVESGQIYRQGGNWERNPIADLAIPQSIKEAVGRRLNRLSAQSSELLQAAAVIGKVFEFEQLLAVAERGDRTPEQEARLENRLLDALDEAIGAQLIRAAEGERFIFTHDKIREVLYEELNPVRCRRLHQRVADGLEKLYTGKAFEAHVQDLAYHYLQSGDLRKGLDYSLHAAQRAYRLYAYDEAQRYYQYAAECAEGLELPDRLVEANTALGDILVLRGLILPAVEHYQRALELEAAGEARTLLKTKIGSAYARDGDERGLALLQAAQQEVDPAVHPDVLAQILTLLGRYQHYRAQHAQAIGYFELALRLLEPLDETLPLTYAYAYLAGAYQHMARFEDSMHWARQCLELGERKNSPHSQSLGYEFLAEALMIIGLWPEVLDYSRRSREISERIGSVERIAWSLFTQAYGLHGLGRLQDARQSLQAGLELASEIGETRLMVWLGGLAGLVAAETGESELGKEQAQKALAQADELGQVVMQCWCRYRLANIHSMEGEWQPALELCRQGAALYAPTDNRLSRIYIDLVTPQALLSAGRLDEAAAAAAGYDDLARQAQVQFLQAINWRVQGQIYTAQGRLAEAGQAYEPAISKLEALESRLELGRALFQRACLRQVSGDADAARLDAGRAQEIFEACGARRDFAAVQHWLAGQG